MFYNDARVVISTIIAITIIICSTALSIICYKYRMQQAHMRNAGLPNSLYVFAGQRDHQRKDATDNQKNADAQRDRYYATIHKVALQGDKIPGKKELSAIQRSKNNISNEFK